MHKSTRAVRSNKLVHILLTNLFMYSDDIVHKGFLLSADGSRYERRAGGIHGVADSYCPSHPSVRHICCTPLISPARSIIQFKAFMFLRSVGNCPVCNLKGGNCSSCCLQCFGTCEGTLVILILSRFQLQSVFRFGSLSS